MELSRFVAVWLILRFSYSYLGMDMIVKVWCNKVYIMYMLVILPPISKCPHWLMYDIIFIVYTAQSRFSNTI